MSNQGSSETDAILARVKKVVEAINGGIAELGPDTLRCDVNDALSHCLADNIVSLSSCPHESLAFLYVEIFPDMIARVQDMWKQDRERARANDALTKPQGRA